jgi:hypothetical protein
MTKVDTNLFHDVLFGVAKNLAEVDGTFETKRTVPAFSMCSKT